MRIRLEESEKEAALGRVDFDHHPARPAGYHRADVPELELALAVVEQGVLAAGIVAGADGAQRRLGPAIRLQPLDPAVLIKGQLGAFAPRVPFPLADPGPREAEHVDKGKLAVPIGRSVEVHAQAR